MTVPAVTADELAEFRASLANAGGAGARTAAELPDDRLTARLEEAHGEVWGRVAAGGYAIADPTPALIRTVVFGVAGYLATLEWNGSQQLEQRDPVQLAYDRARELLGLVARGALAVEGVTSTSVTAADAATGEAAIYQGVPATDLAGGYLSDEQGYASRHNTWPYGGSTWG